jgi:spermidine synthase
MRSSRLQSRRPFALWSVFFLSGAAALGYQILWAKMFALTLGHEFSAVVTVVCVIFAGMALGGGLANRILMRLGPRAFARLELFIGLWAFLTPPLILKLNLGWLSIAAILPSAIAMGATLPAMAQLATIPSAYAANTFGAVTGCLGVAYFLMPRFGLVAPVYLCAAANFCAAFLARRFVVEVKTRATPLHNQFAALFFCTGFLGLGFETLGVRLLSLSLEDTVFTFAAILAVYLCGQALGAAALRMKPVLTGVLLVASMILSLCLFADVAPLYEILRRAFGDRPVPVFSSEILTAIAVFALPTFFMGSLFAQLANRAGQGALGRSLLWNSLGAAIGAVVVPLILLPYFGGFTFTSLMRVPPGSTLRELRVGRMATVSVAETPDGNRTLFVNNRFQMGGTAALIPELRHADIPLLLHPNPRRALFIGLGTGITLSACAAYPNLQADGVELLPEVIAVMPNFFPNPADSPLRATNITIHVADARRFIRETPSQYDVIIADLFHPAQDGAAFLYTREHFQRIRSRLAPDGLFCQWLPLHQLDLQTFRDITRTFLVVFPHAEAWLLRPNIDAPVVGLVAFNTNRPQFSSAAIESRLANQPLATQLRRVALGDPVRLFGSFLAGPQSLRAFAVDGRLNTDSFPIVMFEAPAFSYRHNIPTHERLIAFLQQITERTPPIADPAMHDKVARYIQARDVYLDALVADSAHERTRAIDGYIESARISEDFTSGYAQCLAIATAEAQANPNLARDVLQRLIAAQPNRPVAKEMLNRMNSSR